MSYCSPKNSLNRYTCFSNKLLINFANIYNSTNDDKIKLYDIEELNNNDSKRFELWKDIKKKMLTTECKEDVCILKDKKIAGKVDKKELENTFRPVKPIEWNQNKYQWLSTTDISQVMKQYENLYHDFIFIGPVPMDFDRKVPYLLNMCVSDDLCNINISKLLKKDKTKIGIIFNLDNHDQSGSHWVSMYVDLLKGSIYYFDSYGNPPKQEVKKLIDRIKTQGNDLIVKNKLDTKKFPSTVFDFKKINNKTIEILNNTQIAGNNIKYEIKKDDLLELTVSDKPLFIKINDINNDTIHLSKNIEKNTDSSFSHKCFKAYFNSNRWQYGGSECGVYSMHFIEENLTGKEFNTIINTRVNDEDINKKRDFYYRPNI